MKTLSLGDTGASVELLQLALARAGFAYSPIDGIFGRQTEAALTDFQKTRSLLPDGIAGKETQAALMPWYTGYLVHTVVPGDSIFSLSGRYGTNFEAIRLANPGIDDYRLIPGSSLILPLPFPVVPGNISCGSRLVYCCVRGLLARYPFLKNGELGRSVMGRPIPCLFFGNGENKVLYSAAHHANEWITALILLKFTEDLCAAYASGGNIYGESAGKIFETSQIGIVPAVNPDGIDLVTGDITGEFLSIAKTIAGNYPQFSFPSGWKANIYGTDLNLQYPAGWEQAREIKFSQGIVSPAPADFVGFGPLSAPESKALYDFTLDFDPSLILAYHTQGEVIYWRYLDYEPVHSRRIAGIFSYVSGYTAEDTPYESGFAGYKDWFIQNFNRPGFTVEAGLGTNPLPLSQFPKIYKDNLGILTLASLFA